jgi:hypothetical protein
MRYFLYVISAFSLFVYSCRQEDDTSTPQTCDNATTLVDIEVRDYYSDEPVANLDFSVYEDITLCAYWCWDDSIGHLQTDANGKASLNFEHHESIWAAYYLYPINQKQYFQVGDLVLGKGCDNKLDFKVKPANTVILVIKNPSATLGLGKTRVVVERPREFFRDTSPGDEEQAGNLSRIWLDTVPPNSIKTIAFRGVPEEHLIFKPYNQQQKLKNTSFFNPRKDVVYHTLLLEPE